MTVGGLDPEPLRVLESARLSPRQTEFLMDSGALREPASVLVLLPDGYAEQAQRRYPVLYLMHGGYGQPSDWTSRGDAERITAGAPVIVVIPGDGNGGWCTDWHNGGRGGPPMWQTFHIRQLIPWVDASYRTISDRRGRGIAGVSTGGFCAMSYAARHPDLFVWAGSFSGALDIVRNPLVAAVIAAEAVADGGGPLDVFGSPLGNPVAWRAPNPLDLAANLRGLALYLATGNGQSGPGESRPGTDRIEPQIRRMNLAFHQRLLELRIDHVWDDHAPGTHSWPWWQRDLRQALPTALAAFADPPAAPSAFTHTSAADSYAVYGWRVTRQRAAAGFSTLEVSGPAGFAVTGQGTADVSTAPVYRPGSVHGVRLQSDEPDGAARAQEVTADPQGRIQLRVRLGARDPARTAVTIDGA
jgi:diacylglycerol O-acyltransferase/trehalose O-mycolyltransferase